jgi:hypothetical protein
MTGTLAILVLMLAAEPSSPVLPAAVESQIARLKSPNKAPGMTFETEYPHGYDHRAQEAVLGAKRQLIAMGKDAFPALLAHGDDKEYSLTQSYSVYYDHSVGEVCLQIIEQQVDLVGMNYKARKGADGKWHGFSSYFSKYYVAGGNQRSALKKWYDGHETKTLKEMQIEVLEWRIEHEKAIGFPGEDEKEHYLIRLERRLDDLRKK